MDELKFLEGYFPIDCIQKVVKLTDYLVNSPKASNLSTLSLILGWFEHKLAIVGKDNILPNEETFPALSWGSFGTFYLEYQNIVSSIIDGLKDETDRKTIIKYVADSVWRPLTNSHFKDKQHIQSVYNFVYGKHLDCFGIAITVLSVIQSIGVTDIHLALSEDHAWLFYNDGNSTAEITWHGKENQKKRGEPIGFGSDSQINNCWLYLGEMNCVKCDTTMELVSVVNAMNPGMNSKADSEILSRMQQALLKYFYQNNLLTRFPIAICNLADLEEIERSDDTLCIEDLYETAIEEVDKRYQGCHVYPFTYFAGYLFRTKKFRKAIRLWRQGAEAVSRFKYSKDDEEAYKEFNEIANTLLIETFKDKQFQDSLTLDTTEIIHDLLSFFDSLFIWEEDARTPVFHETWAKSFIKVVSYFTNEQRMQSIALFSETDKISSFVSEKMKAIIEVLKQKTLNKNTIRLHVCASSIKTRTENETTSSRKRRKIH